MMHTRSPLLRRIYADSHRHEPWAVMGLDEPLGTYRFDNVLAVARTEREQLLDRIFDDTLNQAGFTRAVELRFSSEVKRQLSLRRSVSQATRQSRQLKKSRDPVLQLINSTSKVLSVGVFKEALTDDAIKLLLGQFTATRALTPLLPRLWQPECLPHFLLFELRSLFAAERMLQVGTRRSLRPGIHRAAHHSRFLIEDTPFHEPTAFQAHLETLVSQNGGTAASLRAARLQRLAEHRESLARAKGAEQEIIEIVNQFGRLTLTSAVRLRQLIRFIRFLATAEELKHVLAVEAAKTLRMTLDQLKLPIETTGVDELTAALR